jgi:hypothetical protein
MSTEKLDLNGATIAVSRDGDNVIMVFADRVVVVLDDAGAAELALAIYAKATRMSHDEAKQFFLACGSSQPPAAPRH